MPRTIRVLCLLSATLLAACATGDPSRRPASSASEEPARVVFRHLERGQTWALVNQAHTDRLEFYSQERTDLSTKVVENEVMDALIEYLRGKGRFFEHVRPGSAPASGYLKVAEVELPQGTWHMAVHTRSPVEEQQVFLDCQMNFLALWNSVVQLQTVPGDMGFTAPPPPGIPPKRAGQP